MISILIVGAGKSSTYLIDTLLKHTQKRNYKNRDSNWKVVVADSDEHNLKQKTEHYPNAEIAILDINNTQQRQKLVKEADIVV